MRDGKNVWRQLVCNKEERSANRKPGAETREGCKAMIVVKKAKTGKWIVTGFIKEHNHPLVVTPANNRRTRKNRSTRWRIDVEKITLKEELLDQNGPPKFGNNQNESSTKIIVRDGPY
ncbi:protein FAR1-RELATED SEQUENCE 7 [Senna tora]|uniref:Protein FAR1-RELATED SEQUENCE 7 n=1 Tax=Senna tora TaxID=362788 RepID=A0A835CGE8_9FABA|nr:protein FAR1-RELATED SEQUENCE 7 [Senna tora]